MTHVIASPCIGNHYTACAAVCPVSCIYDVPVSDVGAVGKGNMLIINPDECTNCGLCTPECPYGAIFTTDDIPEREKPFIDMNKNWFIGRDPAVLDAARSFPDNFPFLAGG